MATFANDPNQLGTWPSNNIPGKFTYATLPSLTTYPNLPVGTTAYTTDQGPVYSNGSSWQTVGTGGAVFPVNLTGLSASAATALIQNVALTAFNAGGGIVQLPSGNITLTAPLPFYSGVVYNGTGHGGSPQTGTISTVGTTLLGNGTFPAFAYNALGSGNGPLKTLGTFNLGGANTQAVFLQNFVLGCGVTNMNIGGSSVSTSFSYGIQIGGTYNSGVAYGYFKDIYIQNCGLWGFWNENLIGGTYQNINCLSCGINGTQAVPGGQFMVAGSAGGTSVWVPGNTQFLNISTQMAAGSYNSRGVCVWAHAGSQLNDLNFEMVQCNAGGYVINQTASEANGNSYITVQDSSKFSVGLPVSFASNTNDYGVNRIYFVTAINPGGANTIALADYVGGTAVTNTQTQSIGNIVSGGFAGIEVTGTDTGYVQPCKYTGIDIEGTSTTAIFVQQAFGQMMYGGLVPNDGSISGGSSTDGSIRTLTLRGGNASGGGAQRNYFNFPNGSVCDLGSTNDSNNGYTSQNQIDGPRFELSARGNGAGPIGFGTQSLVANQNPNALAYATPALPSGVVKLSGSLYPDIWYTNASNAVFFSRGIQLYQNGSSSSTFNISGNTQSLFINGYSGGASTWTLPTLNAQWAGYLLIISNPQTGSNTITLTGGGSQNIVGLGVAASNTATVAINSGAILVACNNGGTFYWHRLS